MTKLTAERVRNSEIEDMILWRPCVGVSSDKLITECDKDYYKYREVPERANELLAKHLKEEPTRAMLDRTENFGLAVALLDGETVANFPTSPFADKYRKDREYAVVYRRKDGRYDVVPPGVQRCLLWDCLGEKEQLRVMNWNIYVDPDDGDISYPILSRAVWDVVWKKSRNSQRGRDLLHMSQNERMFSTSELINTRPEDRRPQKARKQTLLHQFALPKATKEPDIQPETPTTTTTTTMGDDDEKTFTFEGEVYVYDKENELWYKDETAFYTLVDGDKMVIATRLNSDGEIEYLSDGEDIPEEEDEEEEEDEVVDTTDLIDEDMTEAEAEGLIDVDEDEVPAVPKALRVTGKRPRSTEPIDDELDSDEDDEKDDANFTSDEEDEDDDEDEDAAMDFIEDLAAEAAPEPESEPEPKKKKKKKASPKAKAATETTGDDDAVVPPPKKKRKKTAVTFQSTVDPDFEEKRAELTKRIREESKLFRSLTPTDKYQHLHTAMMMGAEDDDGSTYVLAPAMIDFFQNFATSMVRCAPMLPVKVEEATEADMDIVAQFSGIFVGESIPGIKKKYKLRVPAVEMKKKKAEIKAAAKKQKKVAESS